MVEECRPISFGVLRCGSSMIITLQTNITGMERENNIENKIMVKYKFCKSSTGTIIRHFQRLSLAVVVMCENLKS